LKTNFRTVTSLGHAISFNTIDISLTPTIESIRGPYWTTLKSHFDLFPQLSKYTLKKIIDGFWLDYSPKVRRYDIPFIETIMLDHLDMKYIWDVVLVNEFIQKL